MSFRKTNSELFAAYEELLSSVEKHFSDEKVEDARKKQKFIAQLVFKATKSGRAVLKLCEDGYGQDALALARSLFETAVNAASLLILPREDGVERFEQFKVVIFNDRLKKSKQAGVKTGPLIENEAVIKANFEKYGKHFKRRAWSKDNISTLAYKVINWMDDQSSEEVKSQFRQLLDISYDAGSDFMHGNIWSILFFVDKPKPRKFTIAPDDAYVLKAVGAAYWGLIVALYSLNAAFNLGEESKPLEFAKRWDRIMSPRPE